jgi:hypothetical protein
LTGTYVSILFLSPKAANLMPSVPQGGNPNNQTILAMFWDVHLHVAMPDMIAFLNIAQHIPDSSPQFIREQNFQHKSTAIQRSGLPGD